MNVKTGTGQMAEGWQLHSGDRITVHDPDAGTVEAVIKVIREGGELDWETPDRLHSGHLHFAATDLVNRLHENQAVVLA